MARCQPASAEHIPSTSVVAAAAETAAGETACTSASARPGPVPRGPAGTEDRTATRPAGAPSSPRAPRTAAAPLVQERVQLLGEAVEMLAFLFTADADVATAEGALKGMPADLGAAVAAARDALAALPEDGFTAERIEEALRAALIDGLGLKPRQAFGPVRVAVTGRKVSPPLFESLEILGRDSALARLDRFAAEQGLDQGLPTDA